MKRDLRGIGRDRRRDGGAQHEEKPAGQRAARPVEPAAAPAEPAYAEAGTVQDAVNQYANKSEAELMGELVNFKKQGVIDDDKLAEVYSRLWPLLNEQQRKRLESVLGTLKNS